MWLAARVMGSPPRKRCSFRGTSLHSNGSGCTGWEPASITSGTPASSTPQCSVSPTPRRWPTTYSQRSTAVPVSTRGQLLKAARFTAVYVLIHLCMCLRDTHPHGFKWPFPHRLLSSYVQTHVAECHCGMLAEAAEDQNHKQLLVQFEPDSETRLTGLIVSVL